MSRCYELGCDQCKVAIWIGQSGGPGPAPLYVYTAEPYAARLNQFLFDHMNHPLRFVDDELRPDDWAETLEHPDDTR